MKKYKLKLDYTADELKELKTLGKTYNSPMRVISELLDTSTSGVMVEALQAKYINMEYEDEFNFMADINNVVMGTAIFPEKKYIVHDSATGQYIYYTALQGNLCWGDLKPCAEKKTKDEWLAINSAYAPMLVEADNE